MTYVISDIHGCFHTLEKLVKRIRQKDESAQLVFVGDYVDRGKHSKECVDYIIQLQSEGATCLRGNHDDIMDWLLNGTSITNLRDMIMTEPSHISVGTWWLMNGFGPTLQSYIETPLEGNPFEFIMKMFVGSVPQAHKDFFNGLPMYWENETHFACHAYSKPDEPLPRRLDMIPESAYYDMLWSRFPMTIRDGKRGFAHGEPVWDRIGVFGHTPVGHYEAATPIRYGNLRLIDTGAFHGEYMTAYCCEQDGWTLQATDSRDLGGK